MKVNLAEQLNAFASGRIIDSEGSENDCFNFYDWFCKDSSLERKANILFPKVKRFLKEYPEIDILSTYVFFKNNCPMLGPTYDDFRICDIESGNVLYTVTPSRVLKNGKNQIRMAEIWGRSNNFKQPIKEANTFTQLFKEQVS
jgi:hypothetical protein